MPTVAEKHRAIELRVAADVVVIAGIESLASTVDPTLGGQTLSPTTGQLTGTPITSQVTPHNGTYDITVAPASATIVSVKTVEVPGA